MYIILTFENVFYSSLYITKSGQTYKQKWLCRIDSPSQIPKSQIQSILVLVQKVPIQRWNWTDAVTIILKATNIADCTIPPITFLT